MGVIFLGLEKENFCKKLKLLFLIENFIEIKLFENFIKDVEIIFYFVLIIKQREFYLEIWEILSMINLDNGGEYQWEIFWFFLNWIGEMWLENGYLYWKWKSDYLWIIYDQSVVMLGYGFMVYFVFLFGWILVEDYQVYLFCNYFLL